MLVRRLGLGLLGLIGGLLAGIVLQDVLAPLLVTGPGRVTTAGRILLPVLLPICGAGGAVLAVLLDRRGRRRRGDSPPDHER